jgi:hypothetical protein
MNPIKRIERNIELTEWIFIYWDSYRELEAWMMSHCSAEPGSYEEYEMC